MSQPSAVVLREGGREREEALSNSSFFALSEFPSPTREGPRPNNSGLGASHRFVHRELTVRVIIVIVIVIVAVGLTCVV